jgi:hypothetical protein
MTPQRLFVLSLPQGGQSGVTGENRTLVDGATTRRSATELRPQLAPGARVERACLAFQASALTATASLAELVEERRIELRLLGCRPSVLPLSLHPHETGPGGWNRTN